MRVAALRKGQRTPLLHLLLLAVMATLAVGVFSTDGGRRSTASTIACRPLDAGCIIARERRGLCLNCGSPGSP
jgi:hypothetical protein